MNSALLSSQRHDWETPPEFFDKINAEFHFTLDPCATPATAKCEKYYTPAENGLAQDWSGETCFVNPPYDRELPKWIKKCYKESKRAKVVMLIPARTDTKAFHDYIYIITRKSDLLKDGSNFVLTEKRAASHRSRQCWWCSRD